MVIHIVAHKQEFQKFPAAFLLRTPRVYADRRIDHKARAALAVRRRHAHDTYRLADKAFELLYLGNVPDPKCYGVLRPLPQCLLGRT